MTRRFSGDPVDPTLIVELCDVARRAPSAGFSQGSHLLVVHGDLLAEFWTVSGADTWFAPRFPELLQASVVVLALADETAYLGRYSQPDKVGRGLSERESWTVPYWLTDTAMVVQNLLLLLEERGLGALYFGLGEEPARLMAHFGVPDHVRPIGAVAIGVRASHDRASGSGRPARRKPLAEVVHVGRW